MKLNFNRKYMDIGTVPFNYLRTLSLASTDGAEISECLIAAENIRDNNTESWTQEWAIIAEKAAKEATNAMQIGQLATARQAWLRTSNYYRTAMFPLPPTDKKLDQYLTLSRTAFHEAAKLFSPPIEVIAVPMGTVQLPAYFLSAGKPGSPTLIAINGGDSTNEELVHWIGFAAIERSWNCIIFEGPGQWSALQLNPGLHLSADYERPVKAVVDYIIQRKEVDANRIALIGYSLGTQFAIRAAAFDKRISACICDGGIIVDVYEAWHAVWPAILQKAPASVFNLVFGLLEKLSPQLHGLTNRFRGMMGLSKPHDIINAWKPFNIRTLAVRLACPLLILLGEAEYEQSNINVALSMFRFMSELTCPVFMHEFTYSDGWAASHCQIGALSKSQAVIFDWLEKVISPSANIQSYTQPFDWTIIKKYFNNSEIDAFQKSTNIYNI